MGMYTEIMFRADLAEETPVEVIAALKTMVGGEADLQPQPYPDHPLFQTDRWQWLGIGSSAYFPEGLSSSIHKNFWGRWTVGIHGNIKNYDSEIQKFFDWIDPYVEEREGTFLGYSLYEENDTPTLYFKKEES